MKINELPGSIFYNNQEYFLFINKYQDSDNLWTVSYCRMMEALDDDENMVGMMIEVPAFLAYTGKMKEIIPVILDKIDELHEEPVTVIPKESSKQLNNF